MQTENILQINGACSPPAAIELFLTLHWIDEMLAENSDLARVAREDEGFSFELNELHRAVEQRAFAIAEAALDDVLEKFALVQAFAFQSKVGKS